MANEVRVWDGQEWRSGRLGIFEHQDQAAPGVPAIFDGSQWRQARPRPAEFPPHVGGVAASFTATDTATLALPAGVLLGDVVVSVCASYGDAEPTPEVARRPRATPLGGSVETEFDPLRMGYAMTLDPTKLHLKVSMFEWTPDKGESVTWRVSGAKDTNAVVMNLVYRQAETARLPADPLVDYSTAMGVDRHQLQPGTDHQSLYIAVALSRELTGARWPAGFTNPIDVFGAFGDMQVHMLAAHTVGAPSSPGLLQLDATVPELGVALITVPGRVNSDGHGVWILGDSVASTLGTTTYLE
ncbi:hypothetical protein ACIQU6_34055 [Streptomyces sp. NPDC090442]|uniref:hypothetical protein n=1 Tax=Streptomyces sp. NPDC090442 TaxID=3365962 RepID=UPI0037F532CD